MQLKLPLPGCLGCNANLMTIFRCPLSQSYNAWLLLDIGDSHKPPAQIAEKKRMAPKFAKAAFAEQPIASTWEQSKGLEATSGEEILPAKGPVRATAMPFRSAANLVRASSVI